MKVRILITLGIAALGIAVVGAGCKKKIPEPDVAYHHSAEGTHQKIQELRTLLINSLAEKNLQFIHDNMYYLDGVSKALSSKLEGDRKQRVDPVLKELEKIAQEIDNSAGRGNQAATEANVQKLIDKLKELEIEFNAGKKK